MNTTTTPIGITDPFFDTSRCVDRLFTQYLKHGRLIVATDFDETVKDYYQKGDTYPAVIGLLRRCTKLGFLIVVFSSSPRSRHDEIRAYMASIGVRCDGINENVINWHHGTEGKIYFNVLLDDKSGLFQAFEILRLTIARIDMHCATVA